MQSSTLYIYEANLAVDGDNNTFSITENGDTVPWWKVRLAYPVWVTRVEIINDLESCE